MTLILIGQLSLGIIREHFGSFGVVTRHLDLARVLGVIALLAGGYLIARGLLKCNPIPQQLELFSY